jgi:hypothetical protein
MEILIVKGAEETRTPRSSSASPERAEVASLFDDNLRKSIQSLMKSFESLNDVIASRKEGDMKVGPPEDFVKPSLGVSDVKRNWTRRHNRAKRNLDQCERKWRSRSLSPKYVRLQERQLDGPDAFDALKAHSPAHSLTFVKSRSPTPGAHARVLASMLALQQRSKAALVDVGTARLMRRALDEDECARHFRSGEVTSRVSRWEHEAGAGSSTVTVIRKSTGGRFLYQTH